MTDAPPRRWLLPIDENGQALPLSSTLWWRIIAVFVAVHAIGRAVVLSGRHFYWDDFIIVGSLARYPLWSTDYLLQEHDGHLAPLSFLVQGIYGTLAPWQWWLPAITLLALSVAVALAFAHLIQLIVGKTWAALLIIVVVLFSPLGLPGGTWWSAGINALPFQLALISFLTLMISLSLRSPRPVSAGQAALGIGIVVVGLGFFEKSLAIVPVSFVFVIALSFIEHRNIVATVRRGLAIWLPGFAITIGWAIWYATTAFEDSDAGTGEPSSELFFNGLGQILAALVGGPIVWERWAPGQPFAAAPGIIIFLGGMALLVLSAILIGRNQRAWAPWLVAVVYLLVTLVAMVIFRSGDFTSGVLAQTLHYYADVIVILGVAVAISCAGGVAAAKPGAAGLAAEALATRHRALTAALVAVIALVSTASTLTYRHAWRGDITAEWLATTTASLASLGARYEAAAPEDRIDYQLIDQVVPYEVLIPVAAPANVYSRVFHSVDKRPEFARVTGHPRMFDQQGTLIDARVAELARLVEGPEPQCGHRIVADATGRASVELPLNAIVKLGDWVLEFPATATDDMQVRLSLPNPFENAEQTRNGSTQLSINNQLRPRYVYLTGGGNTLRIDIEEAPAGAELCVGAGAIGPLVPANA